MADAVLSFVLERLAMLLGQEYAHLKGLRPGLQFINGELGTMKAFLRDVEAQDEQNNGLLRDWVKQVREAAYDIEDVIDEFMHIFAPCRGSWCYGRVQSIYIPIKTLRARHQISSTINDLKSRVQDISVRHQRYLLDYGVHGVGSSIAPQEDLVHHIRQRALLLEEADLVGIHMPKKELLSQIFEDNSHLKVASIVGMAGMGKTTLTKRVYEDATVKTQFQNHARVAISKTFKIESILKDLVQQLHGKIKEEVPPEVQSKDCDGLKVFLKNFLREKRFIIILDDIWSIGAWEALQYAFPDCNCGSRVMLTTRIVDVASAACNRLCGYTYRMKSLSDEESWTLFCNKSFPDKCCPPHLESVSRKILQKCEGLPLAIASVGSLMFLKDKNRLEEWEKVYGSLGGELEGTGKLDFTTKILLLSYNDLDYSLKTCLLYTSLYPEDFEILAYHLKKLWISEVFVQNREGKSREEVAEEYINELVNRSLLQVTVTSIVGSIVVCHVHDLVREITLSKAKNMAWSV